MNKKKKVDGEELVVGQTPPLDPTPSPSPFSKNENGEGNEVVDGYVIGSWKGFTQYQCKQCAFDTLKLEAIEEHVVRHKATPTPPLTPPHQNGTDGEGNEAEDVFEVELKEIDSAVDDDGNEVKTYTVKEN